MEWNFNPLRYTSQKRESVIMGIRENIDEVIEIFEKVYDDYLNDREIIKDRGMCNVISKHTPLPKYVYDKSLKRLVIDPWFQPEIFGLESVFVLVNKCGDESYYQFNIKEAVLRADLRDSIYWFPRVSIYKDHRQAIIKQALEMLNEFRKEIKNE